MKRKTIKRPLFAWALYDWANTAFATTVISGFFPLFFKKYWADGIPVTESTFYLGLGNSFASLIIIIAAPMLGAIADQGGLRKRMLAFFAIIGMVSCACLYWVEEGKWTIALAIYAVSVIGFSAANIFYDALLVSLSSPSTRHRDSAFGYALGYLGGGTLFLISVTLTLNPHWFGFANSSDAIRWSFINAALWWAVFSIPLFLYVQEQSTDNGLESAGFVKKIKISKLVSGAFSSLKSTIKGVRQNRNVWLFLFAYWLYIDGVLTIIKMGVDYGLSIGLPANSVIVALLMNQFIAFPATIFFGRLAEKIGVKKSLWMSLAIFSLATCYACIMTTALEFYVLAGVLGLVQGAVLSLSRSFYSQIIPQDQLSEYFGFANMVGKSAAFLGPVMVGTIAYLTESSRLGMLSILILFFFGMLALKMVDTTPTAASS